MSALRLIQFLWLSWVACWMAMAVSTKRTVEHGPGRRIRWIAFVSLILYFYVTRDIPAFETRILPASRILAGLGVLLTIAGLGFAVWARILLAGNWSGSITLKENHELIRKGPYAIARHPIYTGLLAALFGTELAVGNLRFAIFFAICVAGLIKKMDAEEALMRKAFSDAYADYSAKTKRLIPGIW